ncbi:hypothetical protein Indivirus_2_129 [Indivirus ILV1]|uniref:Uncharacterized protein n=1 Tax=Indivirus ILV1 TaxID=1977633 RepID=A0A1V0SDF0_9VIRU|nr:hypothetical protein Indivirus_2_129 [Indivirus ILV1]
MDGNPDICPWYDDNIKINNKRLWYPTNVFNNDNIKNKFDSKIIDFKSFSPVKKNASIDIKVPLINNIKYDTYKCKLSHYTNIMNLIKKYYKTSREYFLNSTDLLHP